jgi:hypothetical protein
MSARGPVRVVEGREGVRGEAGDEGEEGEAGEGGDAEGMVMVDVEPRSTT